MDVLYKWRTYVKHAHRVELASPGDVRDVWALNERLVEGNVLNLLVESLVELDFMAIERKC